MAFHLLHIITFLMLVVVGTNGAILPPQLYWKSMLPNTPMPKAITNLLLPENKEKATWIDVSKSVAGNDDVEEELFFPFVYNIYEASETQLHYKPNVARFFLEKDLHHGTKLNLQFTKTTSNNKAKFLPIICTAGWWNPQKATWMDLSKSVNAGKFVIPPLPFVYIYEASEITLHYNPNVTLFFLEKDLHHGKKLNLQFTKKSTNYEAKFLPREVANSIPFSSNKLESILNKFSIKKGSKEAEIVKHTLSECKEKGIKGEEKLCVTSLESMVDFTISKLGKNVEVVSTEVEKESSEVQEYVIEKDVKKLGEKNKTIVCHTENYPYAIFYCHKTDTTEVYSVSLEGVDGNKVNTIAVCHTDTSQWNPKHLVFQVLKVQPGTVPICHSVPQDHVIWVSK